MKKGETIETIIKKYNNWNLFHSFSYEEEAFVLYIRVSNISIVNKKVLFFIGLKTTHKDFKTNMDLANINVSYDEDLNVYIYPNLYEVIEDIEKEIKGE